MKRFLGLLTAAFLLSCGGGTSTDLGGSSSQPGAGGTVSRYYLPYLSSVVLLNPETLEKYTVDTVPQSQVEGWVIKKWKNFSPDRCSMEDVEPVLLTYRVGSKLFRVDLTVGSSAPKREVLADNVCSLIDGFEDLVNGEVWFFVETAGSDGSCSSTADNERLLLNTFGTKVRAERVVAALPVKSVEVSKFLVYSGGDLKVCSTDLSGCTTVVSGTWDDSLNYSNWIFIGKGAYRYFYCIGDGLYEWKPSSGELRRIDISTGEKCSDFDEMSADQSGLYLIGLQRVIKVDPDTGIVDWGIPLSPHNYRGLLGNYLTFHFPSPSTGLIGDLVLVDKETGSTVKVSSSAYPEAFVNEIDKVFFTEFDGTGPKACVWDQDTGSKSCDGGYSYWAGGTVPVSEGRYFFKVVLNGSGFDSGGTVELFDGSGRRVRTLGTVPQGRVLYVGGNMRYGLGVLQESLSGGDMDLIVFRVDGGGGWTQKRVTNTGSVSELWASW